MHITVDVGYSGPDDDGSAALFARRAGVTRVVSRIRNGAAGVVTEEEAARQAEHLRRHGLSWEVAHLPYPWYWRAMHGIPGRDEQIDNYCRSIVALAGVGVEVVCFVWALLGYLRSEYTATGRGGTVYPRYDHAVATRLGPAALDWWGRFSDEYPRIPHRDVDADEVWENLRYFLERVVPVAERANIKLAVHPDDPPVVSFLGVARVLTTPDGLDRFLSLVPSPNVGLLFCQGTVATMAGVDPVEQIRRYGRAGKLFHVHFRNPRGSGAFFEEALPDEGDTDLGAAIRAYRHVGYERLVLIDHAPKMVGDDGTRRSFAFQLGYAKGLAALEATEAVGMKGAILAMTIDPWSDEELIYARQLGVRSVVARLSGWTAESIAGAAHRVRVCGLTLVGIERADREAGVADAAAEAAAAAALGAYAAASVVSLDWSAWDDANERRLAVTAIEPGAVVRPGRIPRVTDADAGRHTDTALAIGFIRALGATDTHPE